MDDVAWLWLGWARVCAKGWCSKAGQLWRVADQPSNKGRFDTSWEQAQSQDPGPAPGQIREAKTV